jgi:hypothetical protein
VSGDPYARPGPLTPAGAEPIVRVDGLEKYYGRNHVLRGVNLDVYPGETICLIGRSGSGKSTLLRCINFLEEPSAGSIEVDGVLLAAAPTRKRDAPELEQCRQIRTRAQMVFQEFNLFPHLRVIDNLILAPVLVNNVPRDQAIATAERFLDVVGLREKRDELTVDEIGRLAQSLPPQWYVMFTGGEPFMNPEIIEMLDDALGRGFSVLVLTNAMQPMLRPRILSGLAALRDTYGSRLVLRVSLDHYTKRLHEEERGEGTFDKTVEGIDWLARQSFTIALAGRTCWGESEEDERAGYAALIAARGWPVDAYDRTSLVLFPEMDLRAEVPEITESCWGILHKDPRDVMCASSRMVVPPIGLTW